MKLKPGMTYTDLKKAEAKETVKTETLKKSIEKAKQIVKSHKSEPTK